MRGQDEQQLGVFSYVNSEQRIPHDHPLRQLRVMADEALRELKESQCGTRGTPRNRVAERGENPEVSRSCNFRHPKQLWCAGAVAYATQRARQARAATETYTHCAGIVRVLLRFPIVPKSRNSDLRESPLVTTERCRI